METKCPGEREDYAQGTGSASYTSGFRFSFFAWMARGAAGDAAEAALDLDVQRARQVVCNGLCPAHCHCRVRLVRVMFFNGPAKVSFTPMTTFLGLSWGGTYTVTKAYRVIGECWCQQPPGGSSGKPGVADIAPVTGDTHPH